jgi:hypothetical protein
MFDFLRRRSKCAGSVWFRGSIPHGVDQLDGLARRGVRVEQRADREGCHWSATLSHPEWGEAEALCLRDPPAPSRDLLELDPRLGSDDVQALRGCGVSVAVQMDGPRGMVLRDRKLMLRFLEALMGDDGVAAVDHTSQAYWTRDALEDELAHDADLDVQSLYTIHAVTEEDGTVGWMHTHGLGELGRFDFDIVRPANDFVDQCADLCRALAFAIVEGHVEPGAPRFTIGRPLPPMHFVPAAEFMQRAAAADIAVRDDPSGEHADDRVVLCECSASSLLKKLFGGSAVRPSRTFTRALPDNVVLNFSTEATDLMAERSRSTYSVLREIVDEVGELELPVLAKIGYVVDGGGADEREHLWFEVHELHNDCIDGTLLNQPYWIERLNEGDRGSHPLELLSDWSVLTPFGPINPHAFHARRLVREHRDEMLQMLEKTRRPETVH